MNATVSLEGILHMLRPLSADDKRWLASKLYEEVEEEEEHLTPYTMEEINAWIDESEADFAAGRYLTAEEANREIREQSKKLQQTKPMGCTVVAAIITSNKIIVANAGDSRCYGKTRSSLVMLSCDHTLRSKILNESRENGTEIVDLPAANIICKAVGPSRRVKPEINVFPRNDYEKLMLCSDGLTTMVDDSLIAEIMEHLMCEALKNGGTDNITIISANLKR